MEQTRDFEAVVAPVEDEPGQGGLMGAGEPVLGYTLPRVLYEASGAYESPHMLNRRDGKEWQSLSLAAFRVQAEEIALGLLEYGLNRGDRVALYMESDTFFCLADMGCLIAGLIDVPIYLNQGPGTNEYILRHSGSKALFVSSLTRLHDIDELLAEAPDIRTVIVADPEPDQKMTPLPEGVQWISISSLRKRGIRVREEFPGRVDELVRLIQPGDLATIVYTSGTTGEPKGVMLSHENITSNALTAFNELREYKKGPEGEVILSFLPLSHIFARTMYYGVLAQGSPIYFTHPDLLAEDLKRVRPTVFATVPRVLEKVYGRILEKVTTITGWKKKLANWSLDVAGDFELGGKQKTADRVQLKMADFLVFRKWRSALGGRVKFIIAGGAALNAELANVFAAAGVNILQGYGLSETSPVITFNRASRNRAGTVGEPLPGIEIKLAEDGEVLTRGPHIMKGYYKNEDKTREVLTGDGWFHTGDIGEITDDGFLRITDRKKDLFKLSTGKYVMPQPLENRLNSHPLIEQAVVVGPGQKYCAALIFVNQDALRIFAASQGLQNIPFERLIRHPKVVTRYQELIDLANEGLDHWNTIKDFRLMLDHLTIENGMLTPTLKIKRRNVIGQYEADIKAMYDESNRSTMEDDNEAK